MNKKNFLMVVAFITVTNIFAQPQKIYSIKDMPIVDAHTHFGSRELEGESFDVDDQKKRYKDLVDMMDEWGGAVTIDLNGTRKKEQVLDYIKTELDDRVKITMRAVEHLSDDHTDFLWWSLEDLKKFKEQGFVGIKLHLGRYKELLPNVNKEAKFTIDDHVKKMGELGLPFVAMHVGEPPEAGWFVEGRYMVDHIKTEKYIRAHPKTTFIMAHMFWLPCNDSSLDTLAMFFDRTPNLYVDMAAVFMYWDAPEPTYEKLRNFIIKYKDRIIFGTDGNSRKNSSQWTRVRNYLETDNYQAYSFTEEKPIKGLALPLHVLNSIYYWNAAHLIPGIKESLEGLGFEIGDEPPLNQTKLVK